MSNFYRDTGVSRYASCRVTRVSRGWKSPSRSSSRESGSCAKCSRMNRLSLSSLFLPLSPGNVNEIFSRYSVLLRPPFPSAQLITTRAARGCTRGFRFNARRADTACMCLCCGSSSSSSSSSTSSAVCLFIRANRLWPLSKRTVSRENVARKNISLLWK